MFSAVGALALIAGGLAQNCPAQFNQVIGCSGPECGGEVESGHCGFPINQQTLGGTYGVTCCGGHFLFVESGGPCVEGASATACLGDPKSHGVQTLVLNTAQDVVYMTMWFPGRFKTGSPKFHKTSSNQSPFYFKSNSIGGGL